MLRISSKDWDKDIYQQGQQVNRYPFDALITYFLRSYKPEERRNLRILEIGCGTGNNVKFLLKEGFNAVGVDSSQTAVDLGNRFLADSGFGTFLFKSNLMELEFEDKSFDVVLDRGCLTQNSLYDIKEILDEAYRVLKLGGFVLSYTLFGSNHPEMILGQEVSRNSRDNFSDGYFASVGLTSFHDIQTIKECFNKFEILEIKKQAEYTIKVEQKLINETYSVVARKN